MKTVEAKARIHLLLLAMVAALVGAAVTPDGQPVSGRVNGLQGNDHVVIKATGPTDVRATTRVAGIWSMPEVPPGTYTMTPFHARYTFEPSRRVITVSDRPVHEVDFVATLVEHHLGDGQAVGARHVGHLAGRAEGPRHARPVPEAHPVLWRQ